MKRRKKTPNSIDAGSYAQRKRARQKPVRPSERHKDKKNDYDRKKEQKSDEQGL